MEKIVVINKSKEEITSIELNPVVFGVKPHKQAIFDAVLLENAAERQGTKKVKTKGEVSGTGKKPYRQKHTGRARTGSTRNPQWTGGGVAFGPTGLENYRLKLNKKIRKLAFQSALAIKLQDKKIRIVENLKFTEISTRKINDFLNELDADPKTLLITDEIETNVILSTRNLKKVRAKLWSTVSTRDVVAANELIFSKVAFEKMQKGAA